MYYSKALQILNFISSKVSTCVLDQSDVFYDSFVTVLILVTLRTNILLSRKRNSITLLRFMLLSLYIFSYITLQLRSIYVVTTRRECVYVYRPVLLQLQYRVQTQSRLIIVNLTTCHTTSITLLYCILRYSALYLPHCVLM